MILIVACGLSLATAAVVNDPFLDPVMRLATARQVHVTGEYDHKSGPVYDIDGTLTAGGFVGQGQEGLPADTTFGLAITIATWGPVTFVPSKRFAQISASEDGSFAGVNSDGKIVDLLLRGGQYGVELELSDYR